MGNENTPGWGARGIGAPPLISTSLVTRLARRRPSETAKAHLKVNLQLSVIKILLTISSM